MAYVTANGVKLHYYQVGEGPDIVLVHGLTGNLASWHFTILGDIRPGHRITMYDLRGHGRSEMPPTGYTTRDMAADLLGLMDTLGIEKAHLVGHSLGADIALHLALLHPERVNKIVALEAGTAALVHLRKDADWPGWAEWARALEVYGNITVPREKWHDIDFMLRKSLEVPVVFGPGRGLPRNGEKLLKLLDTTTLVEEYQDASGMTVETMAGIQHEVLLAYGSDSTYLGTYDVLREVLPNATPLLLDGGEHFGILEKPAALIGPLLDFIGTAVEEAA